MKFEKGKPLIKTLSTTILSMEEGMQAAGSFHTRSELEARLHGNSKGKVVGFFYFFGTEGQQIGS